MGIYIRELNHSYLQFWPQVCKITNVPSKTIYSNSPPQAGVYRFWIPRLIMRVWKWTIKRAFVKQSANWWEEETGSSQISPSETFCLITW